MSEHLSKSMRRNIEENTDIKEKPREPLVITEDRVREIVRDEIEKWLVAVQSNAEKELR